MATKVIRAIPGELPCDAIDRDDRVGGGNQRIVPQRHRRGAGVVGRAFEFNPDAANADNRGDDADVETPRLEHDALLDMEFEERLDVVAQRGRQAIGIAADLRATPRGVFRVGPRRLEHCGLERSGHAAAADA